MNDDHQAITLCGVDGCEELARYVETGDGRAHSQAGAGGGADR